MEPNQIPVTPAPVEESAKPKTSYGTLVALVVIVLLIAGGALYALKERMGDVATSPGTLTEQSDSTEPSAIEGDLSAESPDEFNAELETAFDELNASFEAQ